MGGASARSLAVAAVVALPAVAAAVSLTMVETYRIASPDAELFGGRPPATLADSLRDRYGVEQTYGFIRNGQDPNATMLFSDEELTAGQQVEVSPLLLATAVRDDSAVRMLLTFGARPELPQHRTAVCLAQELGSQPIVDALLPAGESGIPAACTAMRREASTPLLAWLP